MLGDRSDDAAETAAPDPAEPEGDRNRNRDRDRDDPVEPQRVGDEHVGHGHQTGAVDGEGPRLPITQRQPRTRGERRKEAEKDGDRVVADDVGLVASDERQEATGSGADRDHTPVGNEHAVVDTEAPRNQAAAGAPMKRERSEQPRGRSVGRGGGGEQQRRGQHLEGGKRSAAAGGGAGDLGEQRRVLRRPADPERDGQGREQERQTTDDRDQEPDRQLTENAAPPVSKVAELPDRVRGRLDPGGQRHAERHRQEDRDPLPVAEQRCRLRGRGRLGADPGDEDDQRAG